MNKKSLSIRYFQSGTIILLIGSFLDSLRGPLIPLLTKDLGLNYSQASWLMISGSLLSIVMTFLLIPVMRKYTERQVSLAAVTLSAVACLLGLAVRDFGSLILFSCILGIAIGLLGAMCNIMALKGAEPRTQSRYLSGLHMVYGIGSLLAPIVLVAIMNAGFKWPMILMSALPALALGFVFIFRLENLEVATEVETSSSMMFDRRHFGLLLLVGFYVSGEVMTSSWLVTYLLEYKNIEFDSAAVQMSLFFGVLTLSRLFNIFYLNPRTEKNILVGSIILPILFFFLAYFLELDFLFPMVGVVGAFFPILLSGMKTRFEEFWRSLTVWVIVFMQGFIGVSHWIMGQVVENFSAREAYLLPLFCFCIALILLKLNWAEFYRRT